MSEYGIILENDKNEKIVELLRVLKIIGENKMEGTEEVKKCKFCGAELKADVLFCTNCGKKVEEEEKKVCVKCGAELAEDAKFCPKCGEKVITSITCPKCGKELQPDSKFCQFCGTNLTETLECPKCHVELPLGTKFCPECGCNIQNPDLDDDSDDDDECNNCDSDDNDYDDEEDDYSDYSDDDDSDNYFYYEEEKSTKEKIIEIVDKYINVIGKGGSTTIYNFSEISSGSYEQVFQNVRLKIVPGVTKDDILGFIDTTAFGKGKNGLVFTADALYDKQPGGSVRIPYYGITDMYIKGSSLYFKDSDGWGKGLCNIPEIDLGSSFYNVVAIKDCLEEIKSVL